MGLFSCGNSARENGRVSSQSYLPFLIHGDLRTASSRTPQWQGFRVIAPPPRSLADNGVSQAVRIVTVLGVKRDACSTGSLTILPSGKSLPHIRRVGQAHTCRDVSVS